MANQASAEDIPKPRQQTSQGVSPEDIVCKEGRVLVWKNGGMPSCVKPTSVLKLVESGWLPPDTIDRISISEKQLDETSENTYVFQFDYCAAEYNEDALGILVSSDTEKIPVPVDPDIQIDQCQQYGTQIHALSDSSLDVSLFYQNDIQSVIKDFDRKKTNLEDDLVRNQQKLLKLQDPNLNGENIEKIEQAKKQIEWINDIIQSCKEGLRTLKTM